MQARLHNTIALTRWAVLAITACWCITFAGCGSRQHQYVIGFSQCVESDAWRKTMKEEMARELAFHPNVRFLYREADGNSDTQVEQVKELLSRNIDLLIISPNEAEPLTPIVEQTFNRGIPVIVVDRKITTPSYTAYVGGDNYQIGKIAGLYAANLLKGKGNVVLITGLPKSTPAIERTRGFEEGIAGYPSLRLLKKINGQWYNSVAKEALEKENLANIDLVFAQNDMMARGVYEVYRNKNMAAPKIIGVDGLACKGCGMQMVSEGRITATMFYPTGGEEAIRLAMKILKSEPFVRENKLQTTVVDSTNVTLMQLQAAKISTQTQSIERQQNMLAQQQKLYRSQQNLLYILAAVLAVALVLAAITLYLLRAKRRVNRQLQHQNQEVLNQRNQLIDMSAKAQSANEAKVNFFTNISHEFRTPLTLILGPLEELMAKTKANAAMYPSVTLIHKNVIRLLRLVNQLMDFRKVEVDKMKVKASENDIVAFVGEIVQAYTTVAKQRNIDLRMITGERRLMAWFDVNMLDKVVFNLLSNAFKFTGDNGFVYVHVQKSDDGNWVEIKIEDNGVGMGQQTLEHAFEVFYQGEDEKHKGTGLGLPLSKELVALHKGTIGVTSQKWKGTTFNLRLPLGRQHLADDEIATAHPAETPQYEHEKVYTADLLPATPQPATTGDPSAKEATILVIEDNNDLRQFITSRFGNTFNMLEAANAQEALQQAFDHVPDLVICDVVIPGKDGLSLVNILKSDVRTAHIPVILLTAKSSIEQQIEGMRSLADVYITKPFNVQFLQQTIASLLANRARLKEHYTSEISSNLKTQTLAKNDRKFISEFTAHVEQHLASDTLSVDDICKALGISRVQLYRKTKALLSMNVNDYILHSRLQKARYLLKNEEMTVGEVSYKVGFSSPAYFSTVFKAKFGISPRAYKES